MKALATVAAIFAFGYSLASQAGQPNFFEHLQKEGLLKGQYESKGGDAFLKGQIFSKLEKLTTTKHCEAVFCHDEELQKKLTEEMNRGRLILVALPSSGFNAAIVKETNETNFLKQKWATQGQTPLKNVLVITPKTLLTTVAHELSHAEDDEKEILKPLMDETRDLYSKGEISAAQGRMINQFTGEVRAYENEMRFAVKNARSHEYLALDGPTDSQVKVVSASKRDFLVHRLQEIDWKVRDWYLPRFLKVFKMAHLSEASRKSVLASVDRLLPRTGPYSFVSLVQPHLSL